MIDVMSFFPYKRVKRIGYLSLEACEEEQQGEERAKAESSSLYPWTLWPSRPTVQQLPCDARSLHHQNTDPPLFRPKYLHTRNNGRMDRKGPGTPNQAGLFINFFSYLYYFFLIFPQFSAQLVTVQGGGGGKRGGGGGRNTNRKRVRRFVVVRKS